MYIPNCCVKACLLCIFNIYMNMMKNQDVIVSIICVTYNHEPYIRQCLEGFVMQKTDFAFEVLIHDDASTDKTADIIREYEAKYPDLIKPIYQIENQYSKGVKINAIYNYPRAKGKYIAFCEGDDYWIDPLKLQKQVDFLEANPEYSMCFHRSNILNELEINLVINPEVIEDKDYSANELFENWIVPTASIVYRSSIYTPMDKYINPGRILNGDIILVLNCASRGKIRGSSDTMSVYRMHSGGVTYDTRISKNRTMKYPDHYLFIKDNFPMVSKCVVNKAIAGAYMSRTLVRDRMIDKMKDLFTALYYHPFHFVMRTFNYFMKHVVRQ